MIGQEQSSQYSPNALTNGQASDLSIASRIERRPARVAGDAAFVSDPAGVGPGVGEHDRFALQLSDDGVDRGPVVLLPLAVGAFATRAVEEQLGLGDQRHGHLAVTDVEVHRSGPVPSQGLMGVEGLLAHPFPRAVP